MLLGNIGRNGLFADFLANAPGVGRGNRSSGDEGHQRSFEGPIKFCCSAAPDAYNVYDGPDLHLTQQRYWGEEPIMEKEIKGTALRRDAGDERFTDARKGFDNTVTPSGPRIPSASLTDRPEVDVGNGMRYKGQWKGQMRHGYGVLSKPPGRKYEGHFENDQMHGHGVWTDSSGITYDGQWWLGLEHGFGKYVHVDGTTYEGEWANGVKSGRGLESWADGAQYEGEFLGGVKNGAGTYTSGTGAEYMGQWTADQMDGQGSYQFADGRKYNGSWKLGQMSGQGTMTYPCGAKYIGGFDADLQNGEGTLTRADGRSYTGHWRDGKQHGDGCAIDVNGVVTRGTWFHGERQESVPQVLMSSQEELTQTKDRTRTDSSGRLLVPVPDEQGTATQSGLEQYEKTDSERAADEHAAVKAILEETGDELALCEAAKPKAQISPASTQAGSVTDITVPFGNTSALSDIEVESPSVRTTASGDRDPQFGARARLPSVDSISSTGLVPASETIHSSKAIPVYEGLWRDNSAPLQIGLTVDHGEHMRPFKTQLHGGYFYKRPGELRNRSIASPQVTPKKDANTNESRMGFPSVEAQQQFWNRISAESSK